jgi:oxygen-independent coproporphyrinogen-3 oxidase
LAAGVNRLSIGAQSFDDASLQRLGRIHTSADIRRAVEAARAAGFDDINLDLMHGLPGQTAASACDDIRAALALGPTHVSWYQLTLEPNTVFHARPPADLPSGDDVAHIQEKGAVLLHEAGFERYEVSAWARDGRRCRHNLNYWTFGDYLSVGAGAHGKLTKEDYVFRFRNAANPLQYMNEVDAGASAVLEPVADLVLEFMINALRLPGGFSESVFTTRTGLPKRVLSAAMRGPLAKGLVERLEGGTWRPSALGWRFLNDLQAEFLRAT